MPADLATIGGKINFIYAAPRVPWHECGTPFDPALKITATQAVEMAGTDYRLALTTHTATYTDPDTDATYFMPMLNQRDVIRLPQAPNESPVALGTVGAGYHVLQNSEIAQVLDAITEIWPVETHGALGNGDRAFWCLAAGDWEIAGEPVRQYVTVLDNKIGKGAFKITVCMERVVCANTWAINEATANISVQLWHTRGLKDAMAFRMELLRQFQASQKDIREVCDHVAKVKMNREDVLGMTQVLYPDARKRRKPADLLVIGADVAQPADRAFSGDAVFKALMSQNDGDLPQDVADKATVVPRVQRTTEQEQAVVERHREAVMMCYDRLGDQFPAIAGTGWHAFNAVTEKEDHPETCGLIRSGGNSRTNAESLTFGAKSTLKARAFGYVAELN